MPKLVKDGAIAECSRQFLAKDATLDAITGSTDVVPLALWLAQKEALTSRGIDAVWVDTDETVDELRDSLNQLTLVAVHFPAFADGRGFSLGRLVRERFAFNGEIRAFGNVIQDQAHFLKRCGFNAMDFRAGTNLESAIQSLMDFSEHYQAAVDQPKPLFRRRAS
ncbi:DUF934 domain-containing protein [Simiduia sp. 21SJ11W-1]|uniref:DUF934 domain-containing protein n=1 Tax=Simiduia sp. 21SJ11W-1 TaxID=2909669 RepID=UPI00209D1087|nr:DUF934 domain-containing protein [Simiduia sp. 21SJ11W-1]UTA46368.1 DUF934 domain-containing protein [Simiduia sp. 21SJ11W-1]